MKNEPDSRLRGPIEVSLDELLRVAHWPDEASDPLDGLLRLAQWPEPGERLLPNVRRIDRHRTRMRIVAAIGVAAAVLLAAVAIWTAPDSGGKSSDGVPNTAAVLPPSAAQAIADDPKSVAPSLQPREVRLRAIFEQVRRVSAAEDESIDRIVAQRVAEPDGDLEELVQPLLPRRADVEQRLLRRFSTFVGPRESAAVELLGRLGSKASLPLLMCERFKPATHAAAIYALLELADARTLARLEDDEWDDDLRQEIADAAQSQESPQRTTSTLFTQGDQSCVECRSDYWPHAPLF
jgi:hypothetical protein